MSLFSTLSFSLVLYLSFAYHIILSIISQVFLSSFSFVLFCLRFILLYLLLITILVSCSLPFHSFPLLSSYLFIGLSVNLPPMSLFLSTILFLPSSSSTFIFPNAPCLPYLLPISHILPFHSVPSSFSYILGLLSFFQFIFPILLLPLLITHTPTHSSPLHLFIYSLPSPPRRHSGTLAFYFTLVFTSLIEKLS